MATRYQVTTGTGLKFDSYVDTYGGIASVIRPFTILAGDGDSEIAAVKNADASATAYGLVTRPAGMVAHDGVDIGSPLKVGGKVSTSEPTAVAAADRTDARFFNEGSLAVRNLGGIGKIMLAGDATPRALQVATVNNAAVDTTGSSLVGAAVGLFIHVLAITWGASAVTASGLGIELRETSGSGGLLWNAMCNVNVGGTLAPQPPLFVCKTSAANTALFIRCTSGTSVTMQVSVLYCYSSAAVT